MSIQKNIIYIGKIVRSIMLEKQVTKAELARRLNVKPQSIDYLLTRKSVDTDTLYKLSIALDYDFALLYSIKKEQANCDKPIIGNKSANAKITVEIELNQEDIAELNLKKKITTLLNREIK